MRSIFVSFTCVAAIAVAGCNKVSQDQFDQSMARMQAQLDEHQKDIDANAAGLDRVQAQLDSLQADLEGLSEEYHALVERYETHIRFVTPVNFDFDSDEVRPGDRELIERFAHVVSHHYATSLVTVQGYADPAGPEAYNLALSQKRAESVAGFLVEYGLSADLVRSVGLGEANPVAPGEWGDSEGGWENRRVAFVIETTG
jgi:peptidoglycan-associated lipoprotein